MARQEEDREDILREATALVQRIELRLPGDSEEPVVAGFRTSGAICFYFGADPVYQFNSQGELRRGYRGGLLIKAERGKLYTLRRERTDGQVVLHRSELSAAATDELGWTMRALLGQLRDDLQAGRCTITGQVPPDQDVAALVQVWLDENADAFSIADAPNSR
ncbi:hypothetical protein [Lignipirellula cremea]|uniref:Uncharacterized protein n=1 Tax=Lignipirellula cremea TaxID=2528010 RepID=A0A518DS55_9BACT|nr:hypothetical protein [Lignipirellula cremea]QDU94676.1 hypothetical protein Pla8534_24820 [Lignipirellula cremea]